MDDVTRLNPTSATGEEATVLTSDRGTGADPLVAARPVVGEMFGHYRIVRLLGRGGMGDVFEAHHVEHDRHVALKILNQRLAGSEDRARFLREGELAASITHPNTVYIYGSEEIAGAPVIAMELLPGGTLKDLVQAQGPLAPRQAVDLTLQMIAGLAAAHARGILHRDVKPANCFIDRTGAVKVGDFGLSIATGGRENDATGMFQGTPQFAAPEQLQGESLDVRADIYAVGASLFYLLTGQPPFSDSDMTTLIGRVKSEAPRSPRQMRDDIPQPLADVVLQCLAKDRARRPATYIVLAEALHPFSSLAPTPATIGRRTLAGIIDYFTTRILFAPIGAAVLAATQTNIGEWFTLLQQLTAVVYFAVSEGLWRASLGKAMCGMRVTRLDGRSPGLALAGARALIFELPSTVSAILAAIIGSDGIEQFQETHPVLFTWIAAFAASSVLLLFTTARKRNGFAAVHDLATSTRVVRRQSRASKFALHVVPDADIDLNQRTDSARAFGSYRPTGVLGPIDNGSLILGYDARLKRRVWIHEQQPGTPVISASLRDLSRPARLRWLGGQRTDTEAWDAYEALDGRSLANLDSSQPWVTVRRWLLDLATEAAAASNDGSLTTLAIDRVWIMRDGSAKLLHFRAPGAPDRSGAASPTVASSQAWLADVARRGLGPQLVELPLSGRHVLDRLTTGSFPSLDAVISSLSAIQETPVEVPRARRIAAIALCGAVPALALLAGLITVMLFRTYSPDLDTLRIYLDRLSRLPEDATPEVSQQRAAIEVYVAKRFAGAIENDLTWTAQIDGNKLEPYKLIGRRALARHPTVSAEQLERAMPILASLFGAPPADPNAPLRPPATDARPWALRWFITGTMATAGFGLLFAFIFRGGLMLRAFGLAAVDRQGRHAGRIRALFRGAVTWSPLLAAAYFASQSQIVFNESGPVVGQWTTFAGAVAVTCLFLAGAVYAALHPQRGWQDQAAGTRIVPR